MSINSTYKTLKSISEGIYKEKGSKFIAYAIPCYNEFEAKQYLEEWRKAHHQSRHVCYAYRFGVDKNVYRANDDGEPNNSAGIPILGQIQSYDLSNILIGVVRYFGGTKLGVGGLIHAYKTAAKEAIDSGEIIELEVFYWIKVEFNYSNMPEIMNVIKQNNLLSKNQLFELNCEITIGLNLNKKDELLEKLNDINDCKITFLSIA